MGVQGLPLFCLILDFARHCEEVKMKGQDTGYYIIDLDDTGDLQPFKVGSLLKYLIGLYKID